MAGGDGTGPLGQGPRTGRGAGYCAGFDMSGYANPRFGRGLRVGFGRGLGAGRGRGLGLRQAPIYSQVVEPTKGQKQALENDLTIIEQGKKALEQEMESIKKRLEELKNRQ